MFFLSFKYSIQYRFQKKNSVVVFQHVKVSLNNIFFINDHVPCLCFKNYAKDLLKLHPLSIVICNVSLCKLVCTFVFILKWKRVLWYVWQSCTQMHRWQLNDNKYHFKYRCSHYSPLQLVFLYLLCFPRWKNNIFLFVQYSKLAHNPSNHSPLWFLNPL